VLYVDPEWSYAAGSAADRLRALAPSHSGIGLQEFHPGALYVYTYRYSGLLRWRLNHWRHPRAVRAVAARLGFRSPVVLAFHPSAVSAALALEPAALAYYAVDEYTAYGGTSADAGATVRTWEETLLRHSQVAFGVSPRLVQRFAALQPNSVLLENGVDPAHFAPAWNGTVAPHPIVADVPGPRIGLVGQIDQRIDQALLASLARAHREWSLVLVGRVKEGVDVSVLAAEPNIHFVPFQPYEALPAVLRALDVCLVPYLPSDLTHSCNPAKIYEYLAADRPVVATPLEGIVACRSAVAVAEDAAGFERAVGAALAEPGALRAQRRAVVLASDWEQRTDEVERRLEEACAGTGRGIGSRKRAMPGRRVERIPGPPERVNDYWRRTPGRPPLPRPLFHAARAAGWLYYGGRLAMRLARGERPARIRRILVVRYGTFLGDMIVFLPLLAALRERFPHAYIVLGVQPGLSVGPLLEGSRSVDEVRELDFLSAPTRAAKLAGALRLFAEGFDATISGVGYFLSREALLSGAPYRIGLYDGHPLQRLNRRVLPLDVTRHESENNLALVELLTGEPEDPRRLPALEVDPDLAEAAAGRALRTLGVPADAPILAVHAGSKKPSRRWPAERFAAVAARLLQERPELWVVFTGTPGEREVVERIRAAIPAALRARAPSSVGLTDLPALVGLLDRSAAVVSNDTGLMHLARARGAPLLALLGPDNHRRWGPHPWGRGPAVALRYEVPCARCARHECEAMFCLLSLGVDEVLGELRALLDRATQPGPRSGGSDPLLPLERRVRRRDWRALADAGFALPLVSVIVPAGAGSEVTTSIARQTYPNLEIVVLEPVHAAGPAGSAGAPQSGPVPVRPLRVGGDSAAAAWNAVVGETRGEILAFHPLQARWPAEKISADVAALVREPSADATVHAAPRTQGQAVLRRSWLAAQLSGNGASRAPGDADGMAEWLDAHLHTAVRAFADAPAAEVAG
jgi:ADP-heptose:LPS heptosyltransferase/glycosyltransferase involved in cell wall biosynthesis